MAKTKQHYFMCIKCGKLTMTLPRPVGHQYKSWHRKKLYCPNCRVEINCIECKDEEEVFYFKEDFERGLFEEECEESLKYIKGEN